MELSDFVQPVQEHLLPLLDDAMDAAVERHGIAEGRGADSFSFGTDAWSLPARLFRDYCQSTECPFSLSSDKGCVLKIGDSTLRHHKVGHTEAEDINSSFPNGAHALVQEVSQQLLLFPIEPDATSDDVVLAYMANPTDGLCAVYLATVGRVNNGKIVEWDQVVPVWSRSGVDVGAFETVMSVEPEVTPEPQVGLRESEKASQDEDN